MIKDRSRLTTEMQNPASADIDQLCTLDIVRTINSEDAKIASSVGKEDKAIAAAVDVIADCFQRGGRLIYVGAGTSGRLGVLDASECPPTFGVPRTLVQGIIAGGRRALVRSIEGAEDDAGQGAVEIDKRKVGKKDIVIGIAACGLTPFVFGAIARAKALGAATAFVTCAPEARKHIRADIVINPVVGPEIVTGSTRMKAGTATKLVLNMLTTAAMIRIGKVYGNLMVDLCATNSKLRDRSERIVMAATGTSRAKAAQMLTASGGGAKLAILMHAKKLDLAKARKSLAESNQSLRRAMQ